MFLTAARLYCGNADGPPVDIKTLPPALYARADSSISRSIYACPKRGLLYRRNTRNIFRGFVRWS